MEIVFKDGIIQKGDRVKIPKAVVDTLNLKEGQDILIKFNVQDKKMTVEFEKARGKNK